MNAALPTSAEQLERRELETARRKFRARPLCAPMSPRLQRLLFQTTLPHLTRPVLYRCFQRHGIGPRYGATADMALERQTVGVTPAHRRNARTKLLCAEKDRADAISPIGRSVSASSS